MLISFQILFPKFPLYSHILNAHKIEIKLRNEIINSDTFMYLYV